jgi:hypothetical protein
MADKFDVTKGPMYDPEDDKELLQSLTGPIADRAFIQKNLEIIFKFCA